MPRRKERIKYAGAVFRVGVGERKRHGVPSQSQSGGVGKSDTSRLVPSQHPAQPIPMVRQRREEVGMRSQNYFNRCTYTYGFRVAYTPVFLVRACAWLSAPENSTENHFVVLRELRKRKRNECSLKLFFFPMSTRITRPMKSKRGRA